MVGGGALNSSLLTIAQVMLVLWSEGHTNSKGIMSPTADPSSLSTSITWDWEHPDETLRSKSRVVAIQGLGT